MTRSIPAAFRARLQRHRRGLLRAVLAPVALYALYLLAANVFLNTRIGVDTINRKPQRFSAQWDWAMSLYPGHIHARGVKLRGSVRTVEWRVSGDVADGRIQLLPLLRKRLHFGPIEGGVVAVDVVTGKPPVPPTPKSAAMARRKPWELVFDGIHGAQVRHLRFDDWTAEGEGEARFVFDKQIAGGPMEIPPSTLRMHGATLKQGDIAWAHDARIGLDLAMARHVASQVPGLRKLRLLDARLRLSGDAPGLVLEEAADGRLSLRRAGNGGRLTADLRLEKGFLAPGSYLQARAPLSLDGTRAQQDYRVEARIDVREDATALHVHVPPAGPSGNRIEASLQVPGRELVPRDMRALLADAQGRVALRWRFASLAWLNPLLSKGWLRLDGAADVLADLNIVDGRIVDGSTASIPAAAVEADVQGNAIAGEASAKAKVEGGRATVDMDAAKFSIAAGDARSRPYVQGDDLQLQLASSSELARFRDELQARLRFKDARIPDLRAYNRMLPAGSVKLLGGSGRLGGDLSLDAHGKPVRATLQLAGSRAGMQVGVSRIVGDLALRSSLHRISGDDYAIDALQLGATRVRLASAPREGPWWARLTFAGGRFEWRAPLQLDGDAKLRMQDAGFLLALFAERTVFPKWVGRIVDQGTVDATSGVHVDGKSVRLAPLSAHNDRVDLKARLRLGDGRSDGDLYARWGVLGMGMELRNGQRRLHLVGAKRWYDGQASP
jgi:hypothetical protein